MIETADAVEWQCAFVATSVVLGDAADEAVRRLGLDATSASPRVTALAAELQSGSRETRARALARGLAGVVTGLDALRLR